MSWLSIISLSVFAWWFIGFVTYVLMQKSEYKIVTVGDLYHGFWVGFAGLILTIVVVSALVGDVLSESWRKADRKWTKRIW